MEMGHPFDDDLASSLMLDGGSMLEDPLFGNLGAEPGDQLFPGGGSEPWWAMLPQIMSYPPFPAAAPTELLA